MKKNLFGLSAVLLAVIFSAFTMAPRQTEYIFQYDGTSYTSASAVENEANWDFVSTNVADLACDDAEQKACRIKVTGTYITGTAPNITLLSTATVKAAFYNGPGLNDSYHVTLSGSNVTAKSNKLF